MQTIPPSCRSGTAARGPTDAIGRVLTGLGGAWKLAALMALVPRRLRDRLYRWVARNRYRGFGMTRCTVADEGQRSRFLQ